MKDVIDNASSKIAGPKHGCHNEVQAQVKKAKNEKVGNTHSIVSNIIAKKKLKTKY